MRKSSWALLPLLLLPACSSDAAGGGSDVSMTSDHSFDPAALTVAAGTEVSWTNDDDESHTVTAYSGGVPEGEYFTSGDLPNEEAARDAVSDALIQPGETFSVTFDTPGTYAYFCIPHEDHGMTGEIVVEE